MPDNCPECGAARTAGGEYECGSLAMPFDRVCYVGYGCVRRQLDQLQKEKERLRTVLRSIADQCACRCNVAWTARGKHENACHWFIAKEAAEATEEEPPIGGSDAPKAPQ
jgi:hypothetical protein